MSREDIQWSVVKNLEEISGKLDRVISLLEFSLKQQFNVQIEKALGRSESRREIYDLCDGKRSVKDIARILNKSMPNVSAQIGELERLGLVKSRRVGNEKFYYKIIET